MNHPTQQNFRLRRPNLRRRRRHEHQTRLLIAALGALYEGTYGYPPKSQLRLKPYQIHGISLPQPWETGNFRSHQSKIVPTSKLHDERCEYCWEKWLPTVALFLQIIAAIAIWTTFIIIEVTTRKILPLSKIVLTEIITSFESLL